MVFIDLYLLLSSRAPPKKIIIIISRVRNNVFIFSILSLFWLCFYVSFCVFFLFFQSRSSIFKICTFCLLLKICFLKVVVCLTLLGKLLLENWSNVKSICCLSLVLSSLVFFSFLSFLPCLVFLFYNFFFKLFPHPFFHYLLLIVPFFYLISFFLPSLFSVVSVLSFSFFLTCLLFSSLLYLSLFVTSSLLSICSKLFVFHQIFFLSAVTVIFLLLETRCDFFFQPVFTWKEFALKFCCLTIMELIKSTTKVSNHKYKIPFHLSQSFNFGSLLLNTRSFTRSFLSPDFKLHLFFSETFFTP